MHAYRRWDAHDQCTKLASGLVRTKGIIISDVRTRGRKASDVRTKGRKASDEERPVTSEQGKERPVTNLAAADVEVDDTTS